MDRGILIRKGVEGERAAAIGFNYYPVVQQERGINHAFDFVTPIDVSQAKA